MARFDAADVRRYYDSHTPGFVALGEGGPLGAIHRAVWGPGVEDRQSAFHYVEDRIAELIRRLPPSADVPHVVDLGCGVGGSLRYLAERVPLRGTGVTLSPVQVALAASLDRGTSGRVVYLESDYGNLPSGIAPADLAFAIESFVHAPDPARFFDECRRLVRPGGMLAICDDFKRPADELEAAHAAKRAGRARAIERFCRGWRVNTLIQQHELRALALAAGFAHEWTLDLSPYLEIHRTRDRLISALVWLVEGIPLARERVAHLAGGSALQTCLERGWVGYDLAVFRRL